MKSDIEPSTPQPDAVGPPKLPANIEWLGQIWGNVACKVGAMLGAMLAHIWDIGANLGSQHWDTKVVPMLSQYSYYIIFLYGVLYSQYLTILTESQNFTGL